MTRTILKAAAVLLTVVLAACEPYYNPPGSPYPPGGYRPNTNITAEEVRRACRQEASRFGYDVADFDNLRIQPLGAEVEMRIRRPGPDATVLCRYYLQTRSAQIFGGGSPGGGFGGEVDRGVVRDACRQEARRRGLEVKGFDNDRTTPYGGETTMEIRVSGPDYSVLCRYDAFSRTVQLSGPVGGGGGFGGEVDRDVVRDACGREARRFGYEIRDFDRDRTTPYGGETVMRVRNRDLSLHCVYDARTGIARIVGQL